MESEKADFKILFDGTWSHDGAPIKREALMKLFATRALSVDQEGNYWLKTPYEKYAVAVEDVPFVIVDYRKDGDDFIMTTNIGEQVRLGQYHKLILRHCGHIDQTLPYVELNKGLMARLSRPVYYNLIEEEGGEITSGGLTFKLGETSD